MKSVIEEKVSQNVPWVNSPENPVEAFKQAEADNAALVEMLAEVYCALSQEKNAPTALQDEETGESDEGSPYPSILKLLAQPHPGWALVDQLARLKKVADAARPFLGVDLRQDAKTYHDRVFALGNAFADLDCLDEGNINVGSHVQAR